MASPIIAVRTRNIARAWGLIDQDKNDFARFALIKLPV